MSTTGETRLEIISEFHLKELFKNRKFRPELRTLPGRKVEICKIGEPNSDAGPDFTDSLVKIDGITMRGDIEVHRRSSEWYSHGHHSDRNYNSVILHVVGACDDDRLCLTSSGRRVETLELSKYLSDDAEKFLAGLNLVENFSPLKCAERNSKMSSKEKLEYLKSLGEKRFMHKVNKFEERLKDIIDESRPVVFEAKQKYFRDFSELLIEHKSYEVSELRDDTHWEQLLFEGICEGLGYSKNTQAFRKLSQSVTLSFLTEHSGGNPEFAEAILFGAAGLLPSEMSGFDEESLQHIRELGTAWQNVKRTYRREYVDKSEWFFFKLRPQNFPTVRIAGLSRLAADRKQAMCAKELEPNLSEIDARKFSERWSRLLVVPAEGYWSRHFIFGTQSSKIVRMLIGGSRANEIIINAILPLSYLRGRIYGMASVQDYVLGLYKEHPPLVDNNVTLLVKEYLFGGDNVFNSVLVQQGAIQIYRSFCMEKRCERCKIGKAVFRRPAA